MKEENCKRQSKYEGEMWKNVGTVLAIKVETAKVDPEPDEQVAESMASTLKEQVA